MRILFIHEGLGQFETLHQYLNAEGLAHSWGLCSEGFYQKNKDRLSNLVPFQVPAERKESYFYIQALEARIQRSFLIRKAIQDLRARTGLDLIVAHGSGGFPLQLFDEFDIPIISYIEFPSFSAYGADPRYPQPEYARYRDKVFEMTSYHQVLKSSLTITPSEYAKNLFPDCLHERIVAQMEGFDIQRTAPTYERSEGKVHIGFAARDLSSAKGFEQFILIAKGILKKRDNVKFVFCGSLNVLYSYETGFLQETFTEEERPKSFMHYILMREGIDLEYSEHFAHVDFTDYRQFAGYIESMDFFLYPLQFGSANWGIFELLCRGRVVVASNRCFIPEVIEHRRNGLLCEYDDIDHWVESALAVIDRPEAFAYLGKAAEADGQSRFHIRNTAQRYLSIFEWVVHKYRVQTGG